MTRLPCPGANAGMRIDLKLVLRKASSDSLVVDHLEEPLHNEPMPGRNEQ